MMCVIVLSKIKGGFILREVGVAGGDRGGGGRNRYDRLLNKQYTV